MVFIISIEVIMVYIELQNGSGQVVKDIKLLAPKNSIIADEFNNKIVLNEDTEFIVIRNKRLGINRYQICIQRISDNKLFYTTNIDIRMKKKNSNPWSIIGDWHTPEKMAEMFNRPVDPDANKPRQERRSFLEMKSRPGSINYKIKERKGML